MTMGECFEKTEKDERQGVRRQFGRCKNFAPAKLNSSDASSSMEGNRGFYSNLDFRSDDYVPARVIWYSNKMGCGIASIFGDAETCFIHREALLQAGKRTLASGDVIAIKIGRSNCGRYAASIRISPSKRK